MELEVRTIKGPPTNKMSKVAAEEALSAIELPEGSIRGELREIEGTWVASVAVPKVATPPPFEPQEEAAPADGPPSPDGPPAPDDGGGEEGPPSDDEGGEKPEGGEEKGKGGEAHELKSILHMLTTLMGALGLDAGPASPAGPEGEVGPTPPIPGPEGAPSPDEPGGDNKTHTVHERALKPGESPPGTTPIGSPAFASVADDHPWKGILGQKRTFTLESPIGDATMASVQAELKQLADGTGYSVKRVKEGVHDGVRVAKVLVQADNA